ncbi:phosphatase PAP2 family protein [Candidatus Saccharibacteria bacterium]|nr:phosphatase PAP2 family protein [Candidatus Saccharibacteria bacterium]
MTKIRQRALQVIGGVGVVISLGVFVLHPSFPTPDKLLLFLFFVFLFFHQATEMLKRLGPFVALILVYESFRGVADSLNSHVNYSLAPRIDSFLFGNLPTIQLQNVLWHGQVRWYDFVFYAPYLLFFILPLGLALLVWKKRDDYYWRVVGTYIAVFFAGFLTFLLFPAAPPWLASQNHYIEPITRISSDVWYALGIQDFPSFYDRLSPNAVAAIPSLHAAAATLFSLFIFKLFGRRWGSVSLLYPVLIYIGVVYQGEHYAFDIIIGIVYGAAGYLLVPKAAKLFKLSSGT